MSKKLSPSDLLKLYKQTCEQLDVAQRELSQAQKKIKELEIEVSELRRCNFDSDGVVQ